MTITEQLRQILESLQRGVVEATPRVIVGLLTLLVMLAVAKLVERALRALLTRIKFDGLLQQAGLDRVLAKMGLRQSLDIVLPRMAYFLLLLLFARTAADAFGLVAVSSAIAALFGYLPKVIAAVLLLVVGSAVSQFAGETVHRAADESGIEFAKTLGSITSGFILFVVGIMAIGQLEFDTEMVRIVTVCVLGGLALAFAISIGLGTRDITRNVLAGFYARKVFTPGDPIEVRGHRGVLRAITPTQTLIEQDDVVVTVANSVFLDDVVRS
jgi:hypothetical protein